MTISVGKITNNFTWKEALYSATAEERGINNEPTAKEASNIVNTAVSMEKVRSALEHRPIIVSSWFRNAQLNAAVSVVPNSAHTKGYAVDFKCPSFGTPKQICQAIIASGIEFDQLILEYDSWVHISFDPAMRQEVLHINTRTKGYRRGLD